MKLIQMSAVILSLSLGCGAASAQVLGFATAPAGSVANSMGAAIAKVAADHAKLRIIVQPQQSQGHQVVNEGAADLSLATAHDIQFFVTGTGDWAGRGAKSNIRVVARAVPILVGVMVRKNSDIRTAKDLKGKRIGAGFPSMKATERGLSAYLANAKLTYADVKPVLTQNVVTGADDFTGGKTDAFLFALGAGKVKEVAATVGGLRTISLDPAPDALARMRTLLPGAYPYTVKPSRALEEVTEEVQIIAYDFVLFTRADLPADPIYRITQAMHANKVGLTTIFRPFDRFEPSLMAKHYGDLEYHPGAIKFYQEQGLWPPKRD